jgi:phosphoglycolate phosphatase
VSGSLRAAIVDLDGTLVDTLSDFDLALNLTLADLGLPAVGRDAIERTIGKGSQHLIHSILALVGADASRYEQAWPRYQQHYLRINGDHAPLYPGAAEGVAKLKAAGLKLACVTNKPLAFARPLLEKKGLLPAFDHVFGGDSFERKKPDPLPLLKACEALGALPAATLAIGDSSNDAAAARAAGCALVLVSYGYNHGQPLPDADAVVDRLDAIDLAALGLSPWRRAARP